MDKVPATVASIVAVAAPTVPGPTKDEWAGMVMALGALVIREVIWWIRNRRKA